MSVPLERIAMPNLYQEAKEHFNEPILLHLEVVRLIGYAEDGEDCYIIVRSTGKRETFWSSCVGWFIPLRSLKEQGVVIPNHPSYEGEVWTDYSRIDSWLELNGAPKAEEFLVVLKEHFTEPVN